MKCLLLFNLFERQHRFQTDMCLIKIVMGDSMPRYLGHNETLNLTGLQNGSLAREQDRS
jgi:hypothetical protein